jgi:hypothetical protein
MRLSHSDDAIVARLSRETRGIPENKGMALVVVPFLIGKIDEDHIWSAM